VSKTLVPFGRNNASLTPKSTPWRVREIIQNRVDEAYFSDGTEPIR